MLDSTFVNWSVKFRFWNLFFHHLNCPNSFHEKWFMDHISCHSLSIYNINRVNGTCFLQLTTHRTNWILFFHRRSSDIRDILRVVFSKYESECNKTETVILTNVSHVDNIGNLFCLFSHLSTIIGHWFEIIMNEWSINSNHHHHPCFTFEISP